MTWPLLMRRAVLSLNDLAIPYERSNTIGYWLGHRYIQEVVSNCPNFYYVDQCLPILLHIDVSDYRIDGYYIFQKESDKELPIRFINESSQKSLLNWSTIDRGGAFAIFYAVTSSICRSRQRSRLCRLEIMWASPWEWRTHTSEPTRSASWTLRLMTRSEYLQQSYYSDNLSTFTQVCYRPFRPSLLSEAWMMQLVAVCQTMWQSWSRSINLSK